jgi:hypothetical protein
MSQLQEKPSALKREHPALENLEYLPFFYFRGSFFAWIQIRNPGENVLISTGTVNNKLSTNIELTPLPPGRGEGRVPRAVCQLAATPLYRARTRRRAPLPGPPAVFRYTLQYNTH